MLECVKFMLQMKKFYFNVFCYFLLIEIEVVCIDIKMQKFMYKENLKIVIFFIFQEI